MTNRDDYLRQAAAAGQLAHVDNINEPGLIRWARVAVAMEPHFRAMHAEETTEIQRLVVDFTRASAALLAKLEDLKK